MPPFNGDTRQPRTRPRCITRSTRAASKVAALSLLLLTAACAHVQAASRADGDAQYRVRVEYEAAPAVRFAAEELRRYLVQATGTRVDIEIAGSPDATDRSRPGKGATDFVFILAEADKSKTADAPDLGPEDVHYIISSGRAHILGGSPRGTLYAAYEFLEREFGVRFLTADHTHVPRTDPPLELRDTVYTHRTPFEWRLGSHREVLDDVAFRTRLRANHPLFLHVKKTPAKYGGHHPMPLPMHSISGMLNTAQYGKTHPEYFAEVNGVRLLDSHPRWGNHYTTNVCPSHPDVIDILTRKVLHALRQRPDLAGYSVAYGDNPVSCSCDLCQPLLQSQGSPAGPYVAMVNEIARRVDKAMPGKKIGALAYWPTLPPPKDLQVHDNVVMMICPIDVSVIHPIDDPSVEPNTLTDRYTRQWATLTDHLWVWSYNANIEDYLLPYPNLHLIGDTVRYWRDRGLEGVFMHSPLETQASQLADLRAYITNQLLWNPDLDDQAMIEEFCHLHYGPAAPHILQYIDLINATALESGLEPTCYGRGPYPEPKPRSNHAEFFGYNEQTARKAAELFRKAKQAVADDPTLAHRVEKASIPALRLRVDDVWNLTSPEQLTGPRRDEALPILREIFRIADEHGLKFESWNRPLKESRDRLSNVFDVTGQAAF